MFVTPIQYLSSFSNENRIYIKRDDLLPFSFGGNKERIARCLFEEAQSKGCDAIVAYGSFRSNLVRVVANMAVSLGWCCTVVSPRDPDKSSDSFNTSIVEKFDVRIRTCDKSTVSEAVRAAIDDYLAEGKSPYYVYGDEFGYGNEAIVARAYVDAFEEIVAWEKANEVLFDYVFSASGTGMTQAGLICGALLHASSAKVIGISVARSHEMGAGHVERYARRYLESIGLEACNPDVMFEEGYRCGGYGQFDENVDLVIEKLLALEGVPSDPVYVGKGFAGMLRYLEDNAISGRNILFVHTGGMPLFFDYLAASKGFESWK